MTDVALNDVVRYLDQFLRIRDVPDESNAINGLQVENRGTVGMLVAAVDASQATIDGVAARVRELARPALLLVHHGLFWDGNLPVTDRRYQRIRRLLEHDIAVYSAHIPLDLHPEVGNNAVLARMLGLIQVEPFDLYKGTAIGWQGKLPEPIDRERLVERIGRLIGGTPRLIAGGPKSSQRVGIISGAAGSRIKAAKEAGLDTFLTGEGPHHTYFDATEFGVNVIYAGHYATEVVGIKALAEHVAHRFDVPWEFHDHPTGL